MPFLEFLGSVVSAAVSAMVGGVIKLFAGRKKTETVHPHHYFPPPPPSRTIITVASGALMQYGIVLTDEWLVRRRRSAQYAGHVDDPKEFSWLKALGHSVAIAAAFAAPALALSIAGVVNAEKAGEFSGGFVLAGFIFGWIWSYARQQAYSTAKNVLRVILVAMSAYEVFVLAAAAMTRDKQPSLSALEKHPPAMSYRGASGLTLCQQDVGLRLHAGKIDLTPAPDLAETLSQKNPNDAVARWVYREKSGDIVVLMAAKGFDSEESLHSFANGAAGAAEGRMTKVRDSVEWAGDHGTIVLSFRQGQARFDMRCVSAANGDLACVQTIGSGPDRLAGLRDDLSFGSCD